MKPRLLSISLITALTGALLALSACEPSTPTPTDKATAQAPDASSAPEAPKQDPAPVADKAPEAPAQDQAPGQVPGQMPGQPAPKGAPECVQYAEQLCKVAGEQSQTCGAGRVVTQVMPPEACKAGVEKIAYTENLIKEQQKVCVDLAERLCKDLGTDTQTCKQIREVSPRMPSDRCAEMSDHYAEVLGELQRQEEANKPLDAQKQAKIAANDAPSFGPANAAVTIVEFSDFQCPYCSLAANVSTQIKEKYPDKVRVVFRHFPLDFHKDAHLASQASMAAKQQGKFWEYHDLLFKNQKALSREDLEKYAQELKLDMPKFKAALDQKTHAAFIDGDMKLGGEVVVQGTPTMFINGARIPNPTDFEAVSKMIDEELAKKK